jgi:outer membrane protein assembly factor BamA
LLLPLPENRKYHPHFFGIILLIVFVMYPGQFIYSQKDPGKIAATEISGNKRTKTSYLERFIHQHAGDPVDSLKIEEDLRRLRTLSGILNAGCEIHSTDSGVVLHYTIAERYTLLPVGDFGITDDNFWVGLGAMESNLAGRGMYIYGFYRYNQNHTVHMIFRDPYIAGSKWGVELQLKNLPTTETTTGEQKILNRFFDAAAAAKYEIRYENDLLAGISYREQSYRYLEEDEASAADSLSSGRKSLVPFVSWELSRLDYRYFYVSGWRNNLHVETALPFGETPAIIFLFYDELRFYKRLGDKGNWATRVLAGISNEDQTFFSPFIADSYYNFRGIGYRAAKGNTVGLINLEYRQTVYENKIGGIQAVIFTDAGFLLRNNQAKTSSSDSNFHSYAGLGLRFIYKKAYNAILSIDYGLNLQQFNEGGWVIGWGQYF